MNGDDGSDGDVNDDGGDDDSIDWDIHFTCISSFNPPTIL